jgi:thiamine-phosphate pyrophosphorylase
MLIVVSSPNAVNREADNINRLFEAGMSCLHLRKPDYSVNELRLLLMDIDKRYYPFISLHQHHLLAAELGLKRLHFTETNRLNTDSLVWRQLTESGFLMSTSVHSADSYSSLPAFFSYALLGPVFNSISKTGYQAAVNMNEIKLLVRREVSLVAIGGINHLNCRMPLQSGFNGVAVLGAVWQHESPVHAFKKIVSCYAT